MADKIDQLKFGSTSYDIDLPPDATPSIKSLELNNSNGHIDLSIDVSGSGSLVSIDPHLTLSDTGMAGSTKLSLGTLKFDSGLTSTTYADGHITNGNKQINLPSADGTFATQEWVTGKGYTTNTGTVTSVSAGTGLSISGTASVNPTVNIASGYKLPTTTEWSSKSNTVWHHKLTLRINYQPFTYSFDSTSNANTTLATLVSKLNLNPSIVLASQYANGDMIHINSASYSSGKVTIQAGSWFTKNGSNYIVRSSATGYEITIEGESITEA